MLQIYLQKSSFPIPGFRAAACGLARNDGLRQGKDKCGCFASSSSINKATHVKRATCLPWRDPHAKSDRLRNSAAPPMH